MKKTMKYARLDLGTIEAVFNKLGGIEGAESFLRNEIELITKKHIIDCNADPYIPDNWKVDNWKVEEHRKGGQIEFDIQRIELYLSQNQKDKNSEEGHDLQKTLAGKPVLNANVLDYLLANQYLIPEEWKDKYVYFWGTIFCDSDGDLCVRFLSRSRDEWYWNITYLDIDWGDNFPAALLAS